MVCGRPRKLDHLTRCQFSKINSERELFPNSVTPLDNVVVYVDLLNNMRSIRDLGYFRLKWKGIFWNFQ